jgi:L-threonylcarbamoyladenylate synthase
MTGPEVVGVQGLRRVAAALEADRVVAVPGDGGYQLVARHDHPAAGLAMAALRARPGAASLPEPLEMLVGRRSQAVALAAVWSKETAMVTDRMWPGPLTVIVPAGLGAATAGAEQAVVHLNMPAWRPLRVLCRQCGPLAVAAWRGAGGEPLFTAAEVVVSLLDGANGAEAGVGVALVLDGGGRRGPEPTVVDCTVSPPTVLRVAALPDSYVEAALLMGARKRSWFARRSREGPSA